MFRNRRKTVLALLLGMAALSVVGAVDVQREIVLPAQSYLGAGYCAGGTNPPCFDCSGFVTAIYADVAPGIPRMSRDMARFGAAVERSELRPGDLIFFVTGPRAGVITHVAIYMGQDSIIHAISDGPNRGVTVTPLSARYWSRRYSGARRVVEATEGASPQEEPLQFALGRYTGDLLNGEPHGQGRMVMDNGDVYVGEFRDGAFHGSGTYQWTNGDRYNGTFSHGAMDGTGELVRSSGERITGESAPRTYNQTATSPWDTWDGNVMGDFYAWQAQQEEAFEEWKRNN